MSYSNNTIHLMGDNKCARILAEAGGTMNTPIEVYNWKQKAHFRANRELFTVSFLPLTFFATRRGSHLRNWLMEFIQWISESSHLQFFLFCWCWPMGAGHQFNGRVYLTLPYDYVCCCDFPSVCTPLRWTTSWARYNRSPRSERTKGESEREWTGEGGCE